MTNFMTEIHSSDIAAIAVQLDRLLLDGDRIKLLPASFYDQFEWMSLRLWCHARAFYTIPTIELIEWLKAKIDDRSAIEVAAGNSSIGFHLGIPASDSYCQHLPDLQLYYETNGQPITKPLPEVEKLEAVAAVTKYHPQVVVASWLTQKYQAGDESGAVNSSIYGADESEILNRVETYIHIGSRLSHGDKRILKYPYQEIELPGLITRGAGQSVIYVWDKTNEFC